MSKRPHRIDYDSETDWLTAVIVWLERRHPHNQHARIDHWHRIDAKERPKAQSRLAELLDADDLADADRAEFDELATNYVAERRRQRPKGNERNTP